MKFNGWFILMFLGGFMLLGWEPLTYALEDMGILNFGTYTLEDMWLDAGVMISFIVMCLAVLMGYLKGKGR